MVRDRAFRRYQHQKALKRAKDIVNRWFKNSPFSEKFQEYQVHRRAVTPKPCSCYMCGNPRKFYKQRTVKEVRFFSEPLDYEEFFSD